MHINILDTNYKSLASTMFRLLERYSILAMGYTRPDKQQVKGRQNPA